MKTWLNPKPVPVPAEISEAVGGHPLVSEILARRGLTDLDRIQAFLDPNLYVPSSPFELDDMQAAVDRIMVALQEGQRICVWGDFDVDGQTSTTVLVSTLRDLGGVVQYHIPLRSKESHGVNLPVLKGIIAEGIDLLLTCDTGISAHEAVSYARSQGVDVIITDHHDLPPQLPEASAVINPKRGSADHPMSGLPGVGVAYELAQALFERMGQPREVEEHLDLAALGIVADLALQSGDVRYLLQRGLESLRQTQRPGMQMMMEIAEINPAGLTEEHIGFEIAPRLNALGRLGDANQAVEFLTTREKSRARIIANQLEGLNAHRKMISGQVFQAAQAQIEADPMLLKDSALVLSHPTWPGGVIGIVASRLVERYSRPALLIASPPGELARGSARSVPGVDISAAIAAHQDLLEGFGGHPMAAGFALEAERIPEFRQALSETVGKMLSEISFEPTLQIDGYLPLADLSLELVADLERLAPFGPGNPNLVFVSHDLKYRGSKALGKSGEHLMMKLGANSGIDFKAVWWGGGIEPRPEWMVNGAALDLAYTVRSRDYRGQKDVQIVWLDARPVEAGEVEIAPKKREIEIFDQRGITHPLMALQKIITNREDILVWAEAQAIEKLAEIGIQAHARTSLKATHELVIWTTPPGRQDLIGVLETVAPDVLHLFAVDPQLDEIESFIKRLLGLAKYALRKDMGLVNISSLAAATTQREATVRVGIEWLAARGILGARFENDDQLCISEGEGSPNEDLERLTEQLGELLAETAAYRRHFSNAEARLLIDLTFDK
ncbi:MAG: single-stranded-DNA-specific exonuclease RecJ [Anaerolineales bacterium]